MQPIISEREALSAGEIDGMERLYRRYYTGGAATDFRHDLAQKDWVIVLKNDDGKVVGFSTQKMYRHTDETESWLFSGDTVVDQPCRNQPGLAGAFGHLSEHLHHTNPELYWFLICKGPRTFRFLPTFYHRYYPGRNADNTLQEKLHRIAGRLFPEAYDPETGILYFAGTKDRLNSDWSAADAGRGDPETRFFQAANPGWTRGDELACLVPLEPSNLNERGRRVIRAVTPEWRLN